MASDQDPSKKSKPGNAKNGSVNGDSKESSPAKPEKQATAEPDAEREAEEFAKPSARAQHDNLKLAQELFQSMAGMPGGGPAETKREAAVNQLMEKLKNVIFFRSETQESYALFMDEGNHRRVLPLRGRAFARLLARWFHQDAGVPAPVSALRQALELFEARAQEEHPPMPVYNRFGDHGLSLWIDLADTAGRALRIDINGITTQEKAVVTFLRHAHQLPLTTPLWPEAKDGRRVTHTATRPVLEEFRAQLPLEHDSDWLLVRAWMLAAMHPQIPAPMLCLVGPAGSGKTTAARLIRRMLDPSQAESFALQPEERLALTLERHALPIFDNLGRLRPSQANLFCRAVSGTSLVTHRAHSDEERIVRYRRAMILTSIEIPSAAPDWLERALVIRCHPITTQERREEIEYWSVARKRMPHWLGALLVQQLATLRNYGQEPLPPLPRMADYAAWGAASMLADGRRMEEFFAALEANARRLNDDLLEADPLATAIAAFMKTRTEPWRGTAHELLKALKKDTQELRRYTESTFAKQLRESLPLLKEQFRIEFFRESHLRKIQIAKTQ